MSRKFHLLCKRRSWCWRIDRSWSTCTSNEASCRDGAKGCSQLSLNPWQLQRLMFCDHSKPLGARHGRRRGHNPKFADPTGRAKNINWRQLSFLHYAFASSYLRQAQNISNVLRNVGDFTFVAQHEQEAVQCLESEFFFFDVFR